MSARVPQKRQGDARDSRDDAEHHALGHQLPDDPAACRAERAADRHLALATRRARQQQVRHVRRRDEQQTADGAEQHVQNPTHVTDDGVLERNRVECPVLRPGVLPLQAGADDLEIRPQLGERHARLEPRDGREVERPATLRLLHRQDAPDFLVAPRIGEVSRHHADDDVRLRADRHRTSDDRRVAVVAAHPERVAEHGRLRGAWFVVAVLKDAAEQRPGAQHVEESIGHLGTGNAFGWAVAAGERCRRVVEGGNGVSRLVLRAPRQEVRVRKHQPATVGSDDADVRESIGVAEWQRPQQNGVDDREDRGRRADAEGQREDRDGRKARAFDEEADRVAGVGKQSSHATFDGWRHASVVSVVRESGG